LHSRGTVGKNNVYFKEKKLEGFKCSYPKKMMFEEIGVLSLS
jgi:hypothetical protein